MIEQFVNFRIQRMHGILADLLKLAFLHVHPLPSSECSCTTSFICELPILNDIYAIAFWKEDVFINAICVYGGAICHPGYIFCVRT